MFNLLSLLFFIFGLVVGSFLNCLIYRLEIGKLNNRGFWLGRSYCPRCRHALSWPDLIPVVSYLMLGGKCRYCGKKISLQYPLVELATGVAFLSIISSLSPEAGFNFQTLLPAGYRLLISCFLIIVFVYDLKHYIIPDRVVYLAIFASGIWYFVSSIFFNFYTNYEILNTIYSAFGAALFFLAIVLATKGRGMGVGDVKLALFMGLILGWPNIVLALFSAFFIGAIIGIGLIMLGKKTMTSQVPFGPFLVAGAFLAMFFGEKIIGWYLNFSF